MYAIHLSLKLCRAVTEMVFTQEMQRVDRELHLSSPITARRSGKWRIDRCIGRFVLFCIFPSAAFRTWKNKRP